MISYIKKFVIYIKKRKMNFKNKIKLLPIMIMYLNKICSQKYKNHISKENNLKKN